MISILWVDDEIELLKPHIIFLEEKGYEITPVNSGNEALEVLEKIKKVSQMFGYCEIGPEIDFKTTDRDSPWASSKLSNVYLPHADKKMKMSRMAKKKDVWPAFKKFFGVK